MSGCFLLVINSFREYGAGLGGETLATVLQINCGSNDSVAAFCDTNNNENNVEHLQTSENFAVSFAKLLRQKSSNRERQTLTG